MAANTSQSTWVMRGVADVDAELLDRARVLLGLAAVGGLKQQVEILVRADDLAEAGIDVAGQHADLDAGGSVGLGGADGDRAMAAMRGGSE